MEFVTWKPRRLIAGLVRWIMGDYRTLYEKGGLTMDYYCPGIIFVVMMIVIWLDDAGFWKWLKKKNK
jgi:hypothetical protein